MVDSLSFCSGLTGHRGNHNTFVQVGVETSNTSMEAVKPDPGSSSESRSREVGAGVRYENAESYGFVCPLHIPLVIRPVCCTYVVVVR